jgi:hypothetical protein
MQHKCQWDLGQNSCSTRVDLNKSVCDRQSKSTWNETSNRCVSVECFELTKIQCIQVSKCTSLPKARLMEFHHFEVQLFELWVAAI